MSVEAVFDRAALPPLDHQRRVTMARAALRTGELDCDALVITNLVEVRWLTGFTGSNGWAVVTPDEVVLGTDGRYGDRARAESAGSGATVVVETSRPRLAERMIEALAGAGRVGLDAATTSHADWTQLVAELPLVPHSSAIGRWREVKDEPEVARMAAAAAAADAALAAVEPMLFGTVDASVSEADVRNELEYRMRRFGADDRSYETIVASGPDHAARPHHQPTDRVIVEGDTVIIDVGALVDGYHSDMTRSYVIGTPTAQQRELYELVSQSQHAGIAAVVGGVAASEVDRASRDVFDGAGYGDWYLHGTGHGVGLEIHERPFHSLVSDDVIRAGNVVTVEPGLYRGGLGGFRIEDLFVVTEHGTQRLTHAPERPFH